MSPAFLTALGGLIAALVGGSVKVSASRQARAKAKVDAPEKLAEATGTIIDLFDRATKRQAEEIAENRTKVSALESALTAEQARCRGIEREVRSLRAEVIRMKGDGHDDR